MRNRCGGAKRGEVHCKFLLAMVYAYGYPPAEGFDDKRLPDKRQVLAEQYAARCVAGRCRHAGGLRLRLIRSM